jgi:hypothetical protein
LTSKPSIGKLELKPESFVLNTDSVETSSSKVDKPYRANPPWLIFHLQLKNIPAFAIRGLIETTALSIDDPLWGHFILERCEEPIKGVELQLVRVGAGLN